VAEEALAAFVRRVSLGAATECRGPFSEVDSFDSQQGNEEGSEKVNLAHAKPDGAAGPLEVE
jgi:hypothetical protein